MATPVGQSPRTDFTGLMGALNRSGYRRGSKPAPVHTDSPNKNTAALNRLKKLITASRTDPRQSLPRAKDLISALHAAADSAPSSRERRLPILNGRLSFPQFGINSPGTMERNPLANLGTSPSPEPGAGAGGSARPHSPSTEDGHDSPSGLTGRPTNGATRTPTDADQLSARFTQVDNAATEILQRLRNPLTAGAGAAHKPTPPPYAPPGSPQRRTPTTGATHLPKPPPYPPLPRAAGTQSSAVLPHAPTVAHPSAPQLPNIPGAPAGTPPPLNPDHQSPSLVVGSLHSPTSVGAGADAGAGAGQPPVTLGSLLSVAPRAPDAGARTPEHTPAPLLLNPVPTARQVAQASTAAHALRSAANPHGSSAPNAVAPPLPILTMSSTSNHSSAFRAGAGDGAVLSLQSLSRSAAVAGAPTPRAPSSEARTPAHSASPPILAPAPTAQQVAAARGGATSPPSIGDGSARAEAPTPPLEPMPGAAPATAPAHGSAPARINRNTLHQTPISQTPHSPKLDPKRVTCGRILKAIGESIKAVWEAFVAVLAIVFLCKKPLNESRIKKELTVQENELAALTANKRSTTIGQIQKLQANAKSLNSYVRRAHGKLSSRVQVRLTNLLTQAGALIIQ